MKSRIITRNPPPRVQLEAFGPAWQGEEAFIIGGGTSVDVAAVNRLRARVGAHVVVLNSSYRAFPWAEMLFFADERWIKEELAKRRETFLAYKGEVVTVVDNTKYDEYARRVTRETHAGLTLDRTRVRMHFTAASGAINIALHRGVRRIVLVGIDNRDGAEVLPNGENRVHFHEGYEWFRSPNTWVAKAKEFAGLVNPLATAGIEVINASPISTLEHWPRVDLATWLKENPA